MRCRVAFALLLCTGIAWGTGPQAQQDATPAPSSTPSIKQSVSLVNVFFTVSDRKHKFVADLNQQNFKVYEDDVRQDIRFFGRQTDLPLRVGLLLDTSNSVRDRLQFEQGAATDFLAKVIRRDRDLAFLMTVDDQPEVIQTFTNDTERLQDVIMKQRAGGGTALYDAIYSGCQELLKSPAGTDPAADLRRVLVVISDGDDNLSRHSMSEALDMAQRAGIVIYTISTSINWVITDQEASPGTSFDRKYQKDDADRVLQQFADDSGGRAFFPYRVDDLAQSFLDIGDELRNQYSLAYSAPHPGDKRYHTIRIAVDIKGLQVRSRRGYYALPLP